MSSLAAANSASFVRTRFSGHPFVVSLSSTQPVASLVHELANELAAFDRTLEKAAALYALLFALLGKKVELDPMVAQQLRASDLPWIDELLQGKQDRTSAVSSSTITITPRPPEMAQSRRTSTSTASFTVLGGV